MSMTQDQIVRTGSWVSELETELTQANLSLYLQLTPIDEIQWCEVAAAWDRLDRGRTDLDEVAR